MRVFLSSSFSSSLIRNSTLIFILWIIFFPGFFSSDSFGAVEMAKTGEFTNSGTASWALYVRLFSFFGNSIALLTLLGGLLLVFSTTTFAYEIFTKKISAYASLLMSLTPLIWGMGLTLWHDILMTSGLLLVTSFMVKLHLKQKISTLDLISKLILGSVLVSFRPNGLPVLIVFSIFFLILLQRRIIFRFLSIAISVTTSTTLIGSSVILGMSPINNYFAQEWMRNDISCFAQSPQGVGFVEKNIPEIGDTQTWKSEQACGFLSQATITYEDKVQAQEFVPRAWLSLLRQDPVFVLKTHLKRNAYLVPIPFYGLPTPPFLHSTIEFQNRGIEWAFPSIAEKARAPIRLWNLFHSFMAWAGLWVTIAVMLLLISKRRELLAPVVMALSLIVILFVFAPIPDGRYALFVLITGQLALVGKLIEWALSGSNRRPTD